MSSRWGVWAAVIVALAGCAPAGTAPLTVGTPSDAAASAPVCAQLDARPADVTLGSGIRPRNGVWEFRLMHPDAKLMHGVESELPIQTPALTFSDAGRITPTEPIPFWPNCNRPAYWWGDNQAELYVGGHWFSLTVTSPTEMEGGADLLLRVGTSIKGRWLRE